MYKICQTEQSIRRQREIEQGLLALMLRHNYADISVKDICDEMQMPRKSFYRYFSGKDGVLYALIDHTLASFFEMPGDETKPKGTAVGDLDLFFLFWYEHRSLLEALSRNGLSGILMERSTNFALQEGHMPRQFKKMQTDILGMATAFSVCGLIAMILLWHRDGFRISPGEMTKLAHQVLTSPLLPK